LIARRFIERLFVAFIVVKRFTLCNMLSSGRGMPDLNTSQFANVLQCAVTSELENNAVVFLNKTWRVVCLLALGKCRYIYCLRLSYFWVCTIT
jgi:hypothetical protein